MIVVTLDTSFDSVHFKQIIIPNQTSGLSLGTNPRSANWDGQLWMLTRGFAIFPSRVECVP